MAVVEVDAFALLDRVWERLQTGSANAEGMAGALGYLLALREIGAVNEFEAEGWAARFNCCPSGGEEACHAPVAWCNYCGDVSGCPAGGVCCGEAEGGEG